MATADARYAKSEDVHIAYQVSGDGPLDLVLVNGDASHVEMAWELPPLAHVMRRLSSFARLIRFDKRVTGLSDRVAEVPMLERYRGRDVKTTGDGFLATFDGPARAIEYAIAIRDAVRG